MDYGLCEGDTNVDRLALGKLHNSRFDEPLLLDDAVNYFDQFTKRQFDSDSDSGLVRIGDRRASDPKLGVRGGYLKLTRYVIKLLLFALSEDRSFREQLQETYEFSVREAVDSIREQVKECGNILMVFFLINLPLILSSHCLFSQCGWSEVSRQVHGLHLNYSLCWNRREYVFFVLIRMCTSYCPSL